jgi:hypothetical protein
MTFPREAACSKFGGRIRNNSAGAPSVARRSEGAFSGAGWVELGDTGEALRAPGFVGAAGCRLRSQCNPTATECAQIFPHSLDSRQVQTFSMSMGPLMTSPARKDVSPVATTPRRSGGDQLELRT